MPDLIAQTTVDRLEIEWRSIQLANVPSSRPDSARPEHLLWQDAAILNEALTIAPAPRGAPDTGD